MKVEVFTPATTANLGPGFDVLGAALTLGNHFVVATGRAGFRLSGLAEGEELRPNLFLVAMEAAAEALGRALPPVGVTCRAGIPVRSGLGSSASATCGGILAAEALLGERLPPAEELALASRIEGHPDNAAACLLGGLTIATRDGLVRRLPAPDLAAIVFYPGTEVGTQESRLALLRVVPRSDAVFNLGHAGLLVYALIQKEYGLLGEACQDRLHEPQRLSLCPLALEAREAALRAGAYAVPISGSGPSVIALTPPAAGAKVTAALRRIARRHSRARVFPLRFSEEGARARVVA